MDEQQHMEKMDLIKTIKDLKAENLQLEEQNVQSAACILAMKRKLQAIKRVAEEEITISIAQIASVESSPSNEGGYSNLCTSMEDEQQIAKKAKFPAMGVSSERDACKVGPIHESNRMRSDIEEEQKVAKKGKLSVKDDSTQRDAREAGEITHYADGFHIVWKGNRKNKDCLHDAVGRRYCVYTQPKTMYTKPTDREAYWWCTGQHKKDKGSLGKRCTMVIHELDGVFRPVQGKYHVGSHRQSFRLIKECPACLSFHHQRNNNK